ncbi:nuclear transport factor 2 family protein [Caenimonas terrae]|uniref:Nuclear transport factor 2 family protein n=1 Tax=Caenimonas terrae TaxID=696074 RepID=A0ABW0N9T5_9BURK
MNEPAATAEDVVLLTQGLNAFFNHLDERRYGELAAMFLPAGRWLRQGRWLEGHAAIAAALNGRPATTRVRHIVSNVVVARRGADEADVQAYLTAYRRLENQAPALFSINLVGNVFRRQAGRWLLAEQQLVREFEFEAA